MARLTHNLLFHKGGKPLVAECNSPAALGGGGTQTYTFDTYYDEVADTVADPTDLLALMGLEFSTADSILEVTREGLLVVSATWAFDNTPGGTGSSVYFNAPDYQANDSITVPGPANTLTVQFRERLFWVNVGDFLSFSASGGTAADTPITYLSASFMRISG